CLMNVACAVICFNERILIVQRSVTMALPLKWEFPGGKLEVGESAAECIVREIAEELSICIEITKALKPVTHQYDHIEINLIPFLTRYKGGVLKLKEHRDWRLLLPEYLSSFDFAEADKPIIEELLNMQYGVRNL